MTACVNRKHTKKVAAVVTASLVGALSLGAAPVAAMADTGIDLQFADPEGAFSNAEITSATFMHGENLLTQGADGVWETTYVKNLPVFLDNVAVRMFGTGAGASFNINATDPDDNYDVAYYKRGADGKPADDQELTGDISAVGNYVAVVTAVEGNYKGGVIYVPFDINPIQVTNVTVDGPSAVTYNAESHDFSFAFDGEKVYEGVDYTVYYVPVGHDATEASSTDVKNVGDYKAVITGIGNYAGTVELSQVITVSPLDLSGVQSATYVVGLTSTSDTEPENPYCIWIDGVRYEDGSAIMNELKADIDLSKMPADTIWHENGDYTYKVVSAKGASDRNILNSTMFVAHKVSFNVDFSYDGEALPETFDIFMNDDDTQFDATEVTGHAANGTVDGVDIPSDEVNVAVYNQWGEDVEDLGWDWQNMPGTYSVVVSYVSPDNTIGGFDFIDVTVYREAVNADAKAAVLYDTNGDGEEEVVSSINAVFDGTDLMDDIRVAVEDSNGRNVIGDCQVKYYNAEGKEVGELVNAGTYTLKVTSDLYKISGTTEMTITISPLDVSAVRVGALEEMPFDNSDNTTTYLPWLENGYALSNTGFFTSLDIQYQSGDNWVAFPMNAILVTILDAEGNEIETIMDEGAYTLHFEARNADAENNYVVPADITFHCIKGEHLLFADVAYTDYFADPVAAVNARGFMNGYNDTWLFGSYDAITRGQVACVLYNMATYAGQVDESDLTYNEISGYETGFSDVNGKAYYGKAIAWAKQAGVVNGYGDGTFAPDAPVTREEFAAMVSNYASKYDQSYDGTADTSVLDQFDDASGVSDWATEVVAWAVENGIMGNGGFLNASGDIIRADAACMVYNYAIAE
ncbi:S-layer homology domain-containing protein [Collinsella ihumii]|uniref:S-layer homology domain-containing protein n=1 Tax=Collinsella ihumii TaxID=1720204 RepID=UPI000835003E|nr:S-layer homology domain-containing protein [Collinsella ihumii]